MSRTFLSKNEIQELSKAISNVFSYTKNLKDTNKLAEYIQYPKIPSVLSESIAIHLIRNSKLITELSKNEINFGGRIADITAKNGSIIKKIEVKATGKSAFEYFGNKDIESDYIIWIHFGDSFRNNNFSKIEIFTIKNPKNYFKEPLKITLSQLQAKVGKDLEKIILDLNNL